MGFQGSIKPQFGQNNQNNHIFVRFIDFGNFSTMNFQNNYCRIPPFCASLCDVSGMSAPWGFKEVSEGAKTVGHKKVIVGVLKGFQRGSRASCLKLVNRW